jgi:DNA gyrase/topoisomerase IV subunit A
LKPNELYTPIKDEEFGNPNMTRADLGSLASRYYCLYGVNVNMARAIPSNVDGLKPIHRRILYTIYDRYGRDQFTVGSAIGDVMHLSPHGDQMGDVFAGLAQDFGNNIPLIDSSDGGNAGNAVNGSDAASPRYLQMRLSKFAVDVLFKDFDRKVNMIPSYDGKTVEPVTLPARIPLILLNGSLGIGLGFSTTIPPYNLNEVINATIKLIKNPDAKIRLVPDSPTGCDVIIIDDNHFIFQSSFEINNRNYEITFKNTPYGEFLDNIRERLNEIQDSTNPIPEILTADDESQLLEGEVRYVVRCKPCNLYQVLNKLFKRVAGFRSGIATTNMQVIEPNFKMEAYSVKQILISWINNRIMEKRTWLQRELIAQTQKFNQNVGKAFMLSPKNLNTTIKICRDADSEEDAIQKLVKHYAGKVSSSQAKLVVDIPLHKLSLKRYEETVKIIEEIKVEIERLRNIISNPENIKDEIIKDMNEIKSEYGYSRRSTILNTGEKEVVNIGVVQTLVDGSVIFSETENPQHLSSDVIPINGNDVCLIDDKAGYIWADTTKVPHDKPVTMTSIGRGGAMGRCIVAVSNQSNNIILLSNKGRIKYMPVSRIPSNTARKPLVKLDEDEHLVSVLEVPDNTLSDILIYTNDGNGKRIQTTDLNKVLSVDANGQFIMSGFDVAGMFCVNSNKPFLAYVTKLGRIRINHSKFLTATKKFGECKPIIKLSPQDDLAAVFCVDKDQKLILHHADSRVSTVNIESLPVLTMAAPPERPKHVPGVKVLRVTLQ